MFVTYFAMGYVVLVGSKHSICILFPWCASVGSGVFVSVFLYFIGEIISVCFPIVCVCFNEF